jgi:ubiquinone biosynthesis protein UbiJ
MSIFAYMVAELCEYCGNKFDTRGIGRHRTKCRKSQQKEQEAAEKHKVNAVRNGEIRDLFEKVKVMEHTIEDLTNQLIKLLKQV